METKFISDTIHFRASGISSYFHFFQYQTYKNDQLYVNDSISGNALFGKANDTCLVAYRKYKDRDTVVISPLKQISNVIDLFTNPLKVEIKAEPDMYTRSVSKEGLLITGTDTAYFTFNANLKNKIKLEGWLHINGDSLYLSPPHEEINKDGKARNMFASKYNRGLLLKNNGNIYAAIDYSNLPAKIYLLKDLKEADRLKIAAFLCMVLGL